MKEGWLFSPDLTSKDVQIFQGADSSSGKVAERRANPGSALDHIGRDYTYALLSFALHHGQTTDSLSSRFAEIAGNAFFFSYTFIWCK